MNKLMVIFISFLFLLTACGDDSYEVLSDELEASESVPVTTEENEKIGVYVCGEVMRPGIYYFQSGARIEDAIEAAGGITTNGSLASINLAEYISDCDKVYIPAFGEDTETANAEDSEDNRVNINRASLDELMTLPGIGESKAQSIISYREEHGAYTSVEDIMNITGIKEGVFNKIKDLIKV